MATKIMAPAELIRMMAWRWARAGIGMTARVRMMAAKRGVLR